MSNGYQVLSDLIQLRVKVEQLERNFSDSIYLLYGILVCHLIHVPLDVESRIARSVHVKLYQLPQGSLIGRRLIELDEEFGGLLESKGVCLKRWVYEPRNK